MKKSLSLLCLLFPASLWAADVPHNFTYLGRIMDATGTRPLEAPVVTFTMQVVSANGGCVLFEERHTRNMMNTNGIFSLNIGQGTSTGTVTNDLYKIFDNSAATISGKNCTYSPQSGDGRRLRLSYNDGVNAVAVPQDQVVRSVPYAINSQTLQGLEKESFLQVSTSVTQAKLNDLMARYANLISLADGTNSNYVTTTQLPISNGVVDLSNGGLKVPATPATNDSAVSKVYSDTKVGGKTLDLTGLANGQTLVWNSLLNSWKATTAVNSVVGVSGITATTTAGVASLSLSASGVTPGTYTKITVDASGRVTVGANITAADLPSGLGTGSTGAASGDLSGNYPAPVVAKIQGTAVSTAAPMSNQFLQFNGFNWTPANASFAQLRNASGNAQIPNNCTAAQTLVYSVMMDQFVCTNIAVPASTITGLGSAASKDVAASGNANASQLVQGNDSRLTDSRTPTGTASGDLTGTYPAPTLTATGVTAGIYTKVQVDAKGRVLAGGGLSAAEIPNLDYTKITTGKPTTLAGYGITDAVPSNGSVASLSSGTEANKPSAGTAGRVYFATDSQKIYIDTGAAWIVMAAGAAGAGSVTSITAGTGLTGGTITTSGTINVNVGTGANQIVQLDSSGRLPAAIDVSNSPISAPFSNFEVLDTVGINTWTAPAGVKKVYVEVWGAGGGGSGAQSAGLGGNGGGAGAYAAWFTTVTPGTTVSYKVGAGGNAGALNGSGAAGEASTFNSVSVNGGAGGTVTTIGAGGVAVVSSTMNGINGGPGYVGSVGSLTLGIGLGGLGGNGGNSPKGGAGGYGSTTSSAPGTAGIAPGGGGGAGGSTILLSGSAGGAGAKGRIVIWW